MAKKKVAAIVKIQIPAGKATRRRRSAPRSARTAWRSWTSSSVQRGHRVAGRHDHPGRDHDLRGPHVHVHPQDPADAGAAAPEGRPRQGLDRRRARPSPARSPRPRSKRSPRSRCPTSTPTTSRLPSSRSAAPPARWASRSSDATASPDPRSTTARPGRPRPAALTTEGDRQCQARSSPTRSRRSTATSCSRPTEALELVKSTGHGEVRRDRRGRRAPRRRPPQGRPDGPRHRRAAVGHRQGRPRRRVRRRRSRRRRPATPAPTSSAPTTWPPRSRRARSTSTWPSPRPT